MTIISCAFRWDAWYSTAASDPAGHTLAALSPAEYQWRAPFFWQKRASGLLEAQWSDATMSQEIAAAAAMNLTCWAFLRNATQVSMQTGLALYQANDNRSNINWASVEDLATLGRTGAYSTEVARLVVEMQQGHYQKVGSNRPLVFIYYVSADLTTYWGGSNSNFKDCLDALRSAAVSASLGDPYIVLLYNSPATKTAIGADAISSYIGSIGTVLNNTYAGLATTVEAYWTGLLAGGECAPIAMAGWNRAPRIRRPVYWEKTTQRPYFGLNKSVANATNIELAGHLTAAKSFISSHPTECPYEILLVYAWNEHDEGGWLCPTLGDPPTISQPGGARGAAIAGVLVS